MRMKHISCTCRGSIVRIRTNAGRLASGWSCRQRRSGGSVPGRIEEGQPCQRPEPEPLLVVGSKGGMRGSPWLPQPPFEERPTPTSAKPYAARRMPPPTMRQNKYRGAARRRYKASPRGDGKLQAHRHPSRGTVSCAFRHPDSPIRAGPTDFLRRDRLTRRAVPRAGTQRRTSCETNATAAPSAARRPSARRAPARREMPVAAALQMRRGGPP